MALRLSWVSSYREKPSKCQFVSHCSNGIFEVSALLLVEINEHVELLPQNIMVKRRKKGSESVKNERKRLRLSGHQYTNCKGADIAAKKPPEIEVIYFC